MITKGKRTKMKKIINIEEWTKDDFVQYFGDAYICIDDCDDETKDEIEKEIRERIYYLINYTGTQTNFFPNALKDCENKYYRTYKQKCG